MQLSFDTIQEFEAMASAMGFVKSSAQVDATPKEKPVAKKKTPAKKKAEKPEVEAPKAEEPKVEETEAVVTQADVLAYVKENFSDNVQGIKDMLSRVGVAKISEIPDELCAKALATLKGE